MNIRRINVVLILLLIATLVFMIYQYFKFSTATSQLDATQQRQIKSYLLAYELRQSSLDLSRMAEKHSITGDPKYEEYFNRIADIRDGDAEIPEDYHRVYWDYVVGGVEEPRPNSGVKKPFLERMAEVGFTEDEFAQLAEGLQASQNLLAAEIESFNAMKGLFKDENGNYGRIGLPDQQLAIDLLNNDAFHAGKLTVMEGIDKFFGLMESRTQEEVTAAYKEQAKDQRYFIIGFLVALGLIGLIVTLAAIQARRDLAARAAAQQKAEDENERLNDSVINILEAVDALSKRDLTAVAPVTEDVIGTVSDSINALTSETARVLHGVTDIAGEVATVSGNVKSQADQVSQTAEQEREDVQEMIESLLNATQTMNQVAALAEQSNESAGEATDVTNEALETVNDTVQGMESIRETISETEKRIKRLGERSQEISGIVNLINTISERTHVLALNASMQAAVAGEAGRGFAVVAEEVQRLAESSRNATQQIATLVSNIQIETNETINTVNQTIGQVVEGSEQAQRAGEQMRLTQQITQQLVSQVRNISAASDQQKAMSGVLLESVQRIGESTEQTAQQIEAQNKETETLLEASEALVESVGVFKLPDQSGARA